RNYCESSNLRKQNRLAANRCLQIFREPPRFLIHSERVGEAVFELYATLPHTLRFIAAAEKLLPHPVHGPQVASDRWRVSRSTEAFPLARAAALRPNTTS